MKKEYKTLEARTKEATVRERGEYVIYTATVYFDKRDVICLFKQTLKHFNKKEVDLAIEKYIKDNNIQIYNILLRNRDDVSNVILSEEQLQYLCSDD